MKTPEKCGRIIGEDEDRAIRTILERGNNAEVRRKGRGIVVLEVDRKIKYASGGSASEKSNRS